jgi:hypothetical protein
MKQYTLKCCGCQQQYTTKWRPKNNVWYCSKSCANHFNPRRNMEGKCHRCQNIISASRKHCDDCLLQIREEQKTTSKEKRKLYYKLAVKSYVRKLKDMAVRYKGGKCQLCNYSKYNGSLTFHHLDPKMKRFTISGKSISFERLKPELDKCIMVCQNCHGEIHGGIVDTNQFKKVVVPPGNAPGSQT